MGKEIGDDGLSYYESLQRPMNHYKICSEGSMVCCWDPKANTLLDLLMRLLRAHEGPVKGDCRDQGTEKPSCGH